MKTWVAVGVVLLAAGRAIAQQQEDPVERQVQRLKDQLSLSDDQVGKVREVLKKSHDEVKGLLNDSQKSTYDQGGGGGRGNRGNGNGNGGGNGNGNGGFNGFR